MDFLSFTPRARKETGIASAETGAGTATEKGTEIVTETEIGTEIAIKGTKGIREEAER